MENDESKNKPSSDEYQLPEDDEFMFDELLSDEDTPAAASDTTTEQTPHKDGGDVSQEDTASEDDTDDPLGKLQEGLSGFSSTASSVVSGVVEGFNERLPMLRDKRVIIVASVILVGVLTFVFMRHDSTDSMLAHPASTPSLDHAVKQGKSPAGANKTQPEALGTSMAQTHLGAGEESATDQSLSLSSPLDDDDADSDAKGVQERLSTVENNLEEIQEVLSQANSAQTRMAKQLDALSTQIKNLGAMTAKKKAEGEDGVMAQKTAPKVPPLTYRLRAIVHGRAWVMGSDGSYFTIEKGSRLTGLKGEGNIVHAIDPARGEVLLKNGKVISFNDR